jgi:membrane fusion protein (multidrug efflux system)
MAQDNIKFEQGEIPAKKKKSPVFYIVLIVAILAGAFFGVREYQYSQSHEETDDAQIAADISPVISKISGYMLK